MLNDISPRHVVGLYWVPGHAGVRGNEIADRLARSGSGQRFIGPEPFLGAEYKKGVETLDEESASDIVAKSL
jgi:ribonuclease HI